MKTLIIIRAEDRDAINEHARQMQLATSGTAGGERTFRAPVASAETGELVGYWCSVKLTPENRATCAALALGYPGTIIEDYIETTVPDAILAANGLRRPRPSFSS